VSDSEDGSSGGLVASSRLDSDEPVLDDVDSSDSVLSSESVKAEEDLDGIGDGLLGREDVDLGGDTLGELDEDVLGSVGSVLRVGGELPHVSRRGGVGILEDTGLVGDVEEVLIWWKRRRVRKEESEVSFEAKERDGGRREQSSKNEPVDQGLEAVWTTGIPFSAA